MKKLFGINSKTCAWVFFLAALVLSGIAAWEEGSAAAVESVLVAREKIVGAEPYITVQQTNVVCGLLYGVPVFVLEGMFSATLAELYYAALRFFRGEND